MTSEAHRDPNTELAQERMAAEALMSWVRSGEAMTGERWDQLCMLAGVDAELMRGWIRWYRHRGLIDG